MNILGRGMLKDRLKEVRKHLKIGSQKDFSALMNWTIGRVQDLESGKVKELKASEAEEVQEKLLINGWWLLTGRGEMLEKSVESFPVVSDLNIISVPLVSMRASAGAGNSLHGISEYEIVDTMAISKSLLKTPPTGVIRMIKVEGYSMVPMLYPDTFLLFDEDGKWSGDGLYILNWRDDLMVKLLQVDPSGKLHIKSVNKEYESWVVDPDDQSVFHIVGKVLRIII